MEYLKKKYGTVVEGPMGLQMPESIARTIEAAAKGLPKDFTFRRSAKAADTTAEADSRTDISIITTDTKDRDDEVLLPGGGEWGEFKKNPIVTFDHNYGELPAGSCLWLKSKANAIIAKTFYPTKPEDWGDSPWLPSAILHLLQQDPPICSGKSLGFIPTNVRRHQRREVAAPGMEGRSDHRQVDRTRIRRHADAVQPRRRDHLCRQERGCG